MSGITGRMTPIERQAMPSARRMAPGVASGFLSAASALALLGVSAYLITTASFMPPFLYLNAAIVGVRAFALGRAAFRYLERLASHDAVFRQLATLRVNIYRRLDPIAPAGLATTSRGDVLSRLVSDVDDLQNLPLRVVQPLIVSLTVCLGAVVATALLSPLTAVILVVCLVLATLVGVFVQRWALASTATAVAPLRARVMDAVIDLAQSLDVLIAFDAVHAQIEKLHRADTELLETLRSRAARAAIVPSAVGFLSGIATLAALVVGVPAVHNGLLSGPGLAVIALLPMAVFEVFTQVPQAITSLASVRASADRVDTVAPAEIPAGIPVDSGTRAGEGTAISLRGVTATWPGAARPALAPLDLDVAPGERVVIEASSGSGKSTLAMVLERFLDYDGSFTLGGVEARELTFDSLRSRIGLIEQNPHIFDETLRQNLLFARDTSTDAELLAAVDRVGLGEWAAARDGLDTRLGEAGKLVSGGEAQRIALARALLADFPVLVLDEPTAGVDQDRADALWRDLLGASGNRTVIAMTHTPVADELVDRRVRLDAPPAP